MGLNQNEACLNDPPIALITKERQQCCAIIAEVMASGPAAVRPTSTTLAAHGSTVACTVTSVDSIVACYRAKEIEVIGGVLDLGPWLEEREALR